MDVGGTGRLVEDTQLLEGDGAFDGAGVHRRVHLQPLQHALHPQARTVAWRAGKGGDVGGVGGGGVGRGA